jgi:hypothetical protein
MLIGISSPYRKLGMLYQRHKDYFATDDPDGSDRAGQQLDAQSHA